MARRVAAACHYLGHLNAMKPALTVAENLAFWRDFLRRRRGCVGAALETVGLGRLGHLPFGYLSTGQKRRAAIARLLSATGRSGCSTSRQPGWTRRRRQDFRALMDDASRQRRHRRRRDASAAGMEGAKALGSGRTVQRLTRPPCGEGRFAMRSGVGVRTNASPRELPPRRYAPTLPQGGG